jgi:hypothetical protein
MRNEESVKDQKCEARGVAHHNSAEKHDQ